VVADAYTNLEVLCVARGRRLGIVERVDHAYSVDRFLRDAINHNSHYARGERKEVFKSRTLSNRPRMFP
jgi:hypothetical protein